MEENRNAFDILAGRPTGKRPLGSPSLVWKNNIRTDLKEIGVYMRNLVGSAQDIGYWRAWESGIEPLGSISHGVS